MVLENIFQSNNHINFLKTISGVKLLELAKAERSGEGMDLDLVSIETWFTLTIRENLSITCVRKKGTFLFESLLLRYYNIFLDIQLQF